MASKRQVFVTVGTTKFDLLIEHVIQPDTLHSLNTHKYTNIVIQTGNSKLPKLPSTPLSIDTYQYKPSLDADLQISDLIISHAGCGCILESLRSIAKCPLSTSGQFRKLIVVVNTTLMDNHQQELAIRLHDSQYLFACIPEDLNQAIETVQGLEFLTFPDQSPLLFPELLNEALGLY